jgi:2-isopropylmalate synthase
MADAQPPASLIYDWNVHNQPHGIPKTIQLDDETLRDGLQSPSVKDPTLEQKLQCVHLMAKLGIHYADIGLPGAGPHVVKTVEALANEIVRHKLPLEAGCAARTLEVDIKPIAEISQHTGLPLEASTFLGSSAIRMYTEGWGIDKLLKLTEDSVKFAIANQLPVMFVTEDTTRAEPETISRIYLTACRNGARRICIADTVGHATPAGAGAIVRFLRRTLDEADFREVKIDWHGHNDRGLGVANVLAAFGAGADRCHGAILGIGERVGNASLDQMMVNLKLLGVIDNDLTALAEYVELVSQATATPIPRQYPVFGEDAFRTGTGVHAAAIIKAQKKGDHALADQVYSAVPASLFGKRQVIEIGPMSGLSNVQYWLESRGLPAGEELVQRIFAAAKKTDRTLTESEIRAIINEAGD